MATPTTCTGFIPISRRVGRRRLNSFGRSAEKRVARDKGSNPDRQTLAQGRETGDSMRLPGRCLVVSRARFPFLFMEPEKSALMVSLDRESKKMNSPEISVVVEWENVLLVEKESCLHAEATAAPVPRPSQQHGDTGAVQPGTGER